MVRNLLNQIRERWYFLVLRYFTYLDFNRIARHIKKYNEDLKAQAVIASIAGDRVCADSGMCASKNWTVGKDAKTLLVNKFEATTKERHDRVTNMLLDLTGKPVPPPIEGIKSVLSVEES